MKGGGGGGGGIHSGSSVHFLCFLLMFCTESMYEGSWSWEG